jgi:hypothetical protein
MTSIGKFGQTIPRRNEVHCSPVILWERLQSRLRGNALDARLCIEPLQRHDAAGRCRGQSRLRSLPQANGRLGDGQKLVQTFSSAAYRAESSRSDDH